MHEVAIRLRAAAVLDHINLEEARGSVAPVRERPHGNVGPERSAHTFSALPLTIDVQSSCDQQPVDGRSARLQDLVLDDGIERELSMAFDVARGGITTAMSALRAATVA